VKLAIVGSRECTKEQLYTAKLIIRAFIRDLIPEQVISGGAEGIDTLAESETNKFKLEFLKFLPRNKRWSPDGYEERNQKIAYHCDLLLCIRTEQSETYGSGWTADYAEQLGKEVVRITLG
jgi:predicted Rossmann fold nucleotide-binding protein DprA/Smf involved in DNA uptake